MSECLSQLYIAATKMPVRNDLKDWMIHLGSVFQTELVRQGREGVKELTSWLARKQIKGN